MDFNKKPPYGIPYGGFNLVFTNQANRFGKLHYNKGYKYKSQRDEIELSGKINNAEEYGQGSKQDKCHKKHRNQNCAVELFVCKESNAE